MFVVVAIFIKFFGHVQQVNIHHCAKTPWPWGRMYDILSEGGEIESRRQLEQLIERIGKDTGAPVNDHGRASAFEQTQSQAPKV